MTDTYSKTHHVYQTIVRLTIVERRAPTLADVGEAVGLATPTVGYHVEKLRKRGLVEPAEGRAGVYLAGLHFVHIPPDCECLKIDDVAVRAALNGCRLSLAVVMAAFGQAFIERDPRQAAGVVKVLRGVLADMAEETEKTDEAA